MTDAGDYTVGARGKPPLHSRFKKGDRANPRGRPKGSRGIADIYLREALKKVRVTEGGKTTSRTKIEIIVAQLINQAAGGDLKAGLAAIAYLDRIEQLLARAAAERQTVHPTERKAIDADLLRAFRDRLQDSLGETSKPTFREAEDGGAD